jgi:hypothetical protein
MGFSTIILLPSFYELADIISLIPSSEHYFPPSVLSQLSASVGPAHSSPSLLPSSDPVPPALCNIPQFLDPSFPLKYQANLISVFHVLKDLRKIHVCGQAR